MLRCGAVRRPAARAGDRERVHSDVVQHRASRRADAPQGTALGVASRLLAWPGRLPGVVCVTAGLGPLDRGWSAGGIDRRPLAGAPLCQSALKSALFAT